ncbi:MAG TPA: hypothetical protein PKD52_01615 [Clostridiales bacterium]|nr:hypothetical protein [Clostridiales bacterium]
MEHIITLLCDKRVSYAAIKDCRLHSIRTGTPAIANEAEGENSVLCFYNELV